MAAPRPSIGRDTRWLLIIVAVSLTALSMLARVRFRDTARIAGPMAPLLSQLQPRSSFDEMSAVIEGLLPRLRAAVVPLALADTGSAPDRDTFVPAIRFRDDFVVALTSTSSQATASSIVAIDRATRLAVARSPGVFPRTSQVWEPTAASPSRFFVAVSAPAGQVVARPIFVAAIASAASSRWPAAVWALHGSPAIAPGTLLFTFEGVLAGLIVDLEGQPALVPSSLVKSEAERVLATGTHEAGRLHLEVQTLTDPLKAATGAANGVVISWVEPSGPAAGLVRVGDVIAEVNGAPLTSIADWESRLDRVSVGQPVALTLWRGAERVTVTILASGEGPPAPVPLGLRLRTLARIGARIEGVAERSAAQRAGLRAGDVLTRVGDLDAPTAAQAAREFRTTTAERPLLLGVTRGDTHVVMAMDRRW